MALAYEIPILYRMIAVHNYKARSINPIVQNARAPSWTTSFGLRHIQSFLSCSLHHTTAQNERVPLSTYSTPEHVITRHSTTELFTSGHLIPRTLCSEALNPRILYLEVPYSNTIHRVTQIPLIVRRTRCNPTLINCAFSISRHCRYISLYIRIVELWIVWKRVSEPHGVKSWIWRRMSLTATVTFSKKAATP